jgi:hypothetical protein
MRRKLAREQGEMKNLQTASILRALLILSTVCLNGELLIYAYAFLPGLIPGLRTCRFCLSADVLIHSNTEQIYSCGFNQQVFLACSMRPWAWLAQFRTAGACL